MMLLPSDACVVSALKLDCKHKQAAQIIRLFLQTLPCQGTAELHAVMQDMDVRGPRALGGTPIPTFSVTSVCNATARVCRRSAQRARSARRSCTPSWRTWTCAAARRWAPRSWRARGWTRRSRGGCWTMRRPRLRSWASRPATSRRRQVQLSGLLARQRGPGAGLWGHLEEGTGQHCDLF